MSNPKHTPGPWAVDPMETARGEKLVRCMYGALTASNIIAKDILPHNARLIASAPELLEACQKALLDLQDVYEHAELPESLRLNVIGSISRLIGICAKAEGF